MPCEQCSFHLCHESALLPSGVDRQSLLPLFQTRLLADLVEKTVQSLESLRTGVLHVGIF